MSQQVSTVVRISGMTCEHCVAAVTEELSALEGVVSVDVDLRPGDLSTASLVSEWVLDEEAIRDAVDEAGYDVTDVAP